MTDTERLSAREHWRADLARYKLYTGNDNRPFATLRLIFHNEQIMSIGIYRFGQYLQYEASKPARLLWWIPYLIAFKLIHWTFGVHIFPESRIGPGLYVGHYGDIWVSPKATIGANCSIGQGVVIGVAGGDGRGGPVLGDRVWIGPKATVSGPVRIGSGAVVGANSLAVTNIPENGVVIGVPAKVISYSGSAKLIRVVPEEAGEKPAEQDATGE